jgi:hypothetical protein
MTNYTIEPTRRWSLMGATNAWRLTPRGVQIASLTPAQKTTPQAPKEDSRS